MVDSQLKRFLFNQNLSLIEVQVEHIWAGGGNHLFYYSLSLKMLNVEATLKWLLSKHMEFF